MTGKIVQAPFDDPAKGFHCKAFKGAFSATHVQGTGGTPGQVLATDDFSSAKSGFDTFNTQIAFSQYLNDGRFRVGLRGSGVAVALRRQPVARVVEVSATVLWFGVDTKDAFGLACGGSGRGTFDAGVIRMDGQAVLARYVKGAAYEASDPVAIPAGLLRTGKGATNQITLTCIPDPSGMSTHLLLSLNGQVVLKARNSAVTRGKTGVFAGGSAGGTHFDYESYRVSIPDQLTTS